MKKLFVITGWVIVLISLFILLGFVEARHKSLTCCQFNVYVDHRGAEPLLDAEQIKAIIISSTDSLEGRPIEAIDVEGIKQLMLNNPCVRTANVYTTIQGDLNVKIRQRVPIMRIYNRQNQSFYLDEDGVLFPTHHGFSSRVRVANGHIWDKRVDSGKLPIDIDTLPPGSVYHKLLLMARHISDHPFMSAQIDQLYVDKDGEFELVPKLGNHLIIFGGTEDMEDKFKKLEAFYLDGIKKAGWNKYDKINLKFKDQIVCTKR